MLLENEINPYIKKYNGFLPRYPSYKDITIHKTNDFYTTSLKCYEERIPKLQVLACNLPYIPDEIWCVILVYLMYIEKKDKRQYNYWLYSDYSKIPIPGIKLRTRQLFLPNISGIVMNEGYNIINCAEQSLIQSGKKKKYTIENLSKKFLKYIIRWFHWLYEVAYSEDDNWLHPLKLKYNHLLYTLKLKSIYFVNNEQTHGYTETTYKNFYCVNYYINTYYVNYQWNILTYKDIDFQKYIFENNYYNNVYNRAMKLRNNKRINIFLHS